MQCLNRSTSAHPPPAHPVGVGLWPKSSQNPRPLMFGFGRHMCPGRELAKLEIILFLRTFLRKFNYRLVEGQASCRYPIKYVGNIEIKKFNVQRHYSLMFGAGMRQQQLIMKERTYCTIYSRWFRSCLKTMLYTAGSRQCGRRVGTDDGYLLGCRKR